MTDTTAARSYLEQYQQALRELDYYAGRIETLEAKLHHTAVHKFYTTEEPCLQIAIWREEIITYPVWQKLKKLLKGGRK